MATNEIWPSAYQFCRVDVCIKLWSKIRWPASCARVIGESLRDLGFRTCVSKCQLARSPTKRPSEVCVCLWFLHHQILPNICPSWPVSLYYFTYSHDSSYMCKSTPKKISCVAYPMAERDLQSHESIKKCVDFEQHKVCGCYCGFIFSSPITFTNWTYTTNL